MSTTKLGIMAVVIAVAIVAVAIRQGAVDVVRISNFAEAQEAPPAASASREPTHAQPQQIETLVLQIIARQPGLEAVGLSVSCDAARCEIALKGREVSPVRISEYGDLLTKVFVESRPDFRVLSGGTGTREIAPGAREYVIGFEYQPLEDLSDDPTIAARQQAACAAAWRRLTENPTPDDVVRSYLEQEEQRLALAAAVLGRAEAERLEAERLAIRGGPVHRECQL